MSMLLVGKCADCGKEIHAGYYTRGGKYIAQNYRSFNAGKILRCLECCEKKGIKDYSHIKFIQRNK